ncbi:MAG: hypothetical protein ACLQF0_06740 [Dissulfurispiraceae bacterium]
MRYSVEYKSSQTGKIQTITIEKRALVKICKTDMVQAAHKYIGIDCRILSLKPISQY